MTRAYTDHPILAEPDPAAFLERNRITVDQWETSKCVWTQLQLIAKDHERNFDRLATTAEFFAKTIQRFDGVHSVRWRVKDTEHLLEKIVRKCADADSAEKYRNVSAENYFEIVTDLVGIRALHLFKDDCFNIHKELTATWQPVETPIAYTRKGDYEAFKEQLANAGLDAKDHPAGYRSLHYVVESKPTQRTIRAEIQVRTLFEEGWSEIDHTVRYPNFANDALTAYLLTIFNRMAGSADEMGGFVRQLALVLQDRNRELIATIKDKEDALLKVEATIADLEKLKDTNAESSNLIKKLRAEVKELKGVAANSDVSQWHTHTFSRSLSDVLGIDSATDASRNLASSRSLTEQLAALASAPTTLDFLNKYVHESPGNSLINAAAQLVSRKKPAD